MNNSLNINQPSRWWKFKRKVRRLFMSKKRLEAENIATANRFWACFSEEEKKQQMKYFHDLIRNSDYRRTQIK